MKNESPDKYFPLSPKFPKKQVSVVVTPPKNEAAQPSKFAQNENFNAHNFESVGGPYLYNPHVYRKLSFTPLVDVSDLINSLKGSTYYDYEEYGRKDSISGSSRSSSINSGLSVSNSFKKLASSISPGNLFFNSTNPRKDTEVKLNTPKVSPIKFKKEMVENTSELIDTNSERILNDFNAILNSGDLQQIKSYMRNNNWPVDLPVRAEIWYKLCMKIDEKNFIPCESYDDLIKEYYPNIMDNLEAAEQEIVMPVFLDTKFMSNYHLNLEGQIRLKRLVSILEFTHPDISYGPQIYYLAAIFLHFLDEEKTFQCMCRILGSHSESFVFKTRIGYVASGMVLMELAKKHASSSYDYLADKVKKCLENKGVGLIEPSIPPTPLTPSNTTVVDTKRISISREDKDFKAIVEGVFAHWLNWVYRDLPFEYVVKIMDCYLLQGTKVLYRVALALLMLFKKESKRYSQYLVDGEPRATLTPWDTGGVGSAVAAAKSPLAASFSPVKKISPKTADGPAKRSLFFNFAGSTETSTLLAPSNVPADTPTSSANFPSSASTATLTQINPLADGIEAVRDPKATVVKFADQSKEDLYDLDKKLHSRRHSRTTKYSKILNTPSYQEASVTSSSKLSSNYRGDKDSSNYYHVKSKPVGGKYKNDSDNDNNNKKYNSVSQRNSTGTGSDEPDENSVVSGFTENQSNYEVKQLDGRDSNQTKNVFQFDKIRVSRDSSVDSSFQFLKNRRSTISPLAGYYEYPNIGIFVARYCQDITDFPPIQLIRIAFGIRGLRSHTIDDLTSKYESFAKQRVSSIFLAASQLDDGRSDTISRVSINIPAPPSCGSQILSRDQFRYIWNWIPYRYTMYVPQLLFSTQTDGISLRTFFNRVDGEEPTLIFIKTINGEIFGAYLSSDWKTRVTTQGFFGTGETFVFTMKPVIELYEWIGKQKQQSTIESSNKSNESKSAPLPQSANMFQSANTDSIIIGGGSTGNAIRFYNNLEKGTSHACETFGSPALVDSSPFIVEIFEAIAFR